MSLITDSARGKPCLISIPGHCRRDVEHTVCCHLRRPGVAGVALKPDDVLSVRGCDTCHAVIDGREKSQFTRDQIDSFVLDAFCKTILQYKREGLIFISGDTCGGSN